MNIEKVIVFCMFSSSTIVGKVYLFQRTSWSLGIQYENKLTIFLSSHFFRWMSKLLMDPIYTRCLRLRITSPSPICKRMVESIIKCWCLRLNLFKKVSELEQNYLILYVFTKLYAWKQLFVVYGILMYFILIYRLAMLPRLVFHS